jgi:hypothetical protein
LYAVSINGTVIVNTNAAMNSQYIPTNIPVIVAIDPIVMNATCFQFLCSRCFEMIVMIRIIVMITIPIAATLSHSTISADVNLYISVASVVPPTLNDSPTDDCANNPNTISVAADSPITLPIPRTAPDIICGVACGTDIESDVLDLVAPSARDPHLLSNLTELRACSVVLMIVGKIMNAIVIPSAIAAALSNHGLMIINPIIPNIKDGIPVSKSMNVPSMLCVLPPLLTYSAKNIPPDSPSGNAIAMVIPIDSNVFIIGIARPPIAEDDRYEKLNACEPYSNKNNTIAPKKNTPNIENIPVIPDIQDVCLNLYLALVFKISVVVDVTAVYFFSFLFIAASFANISSTSSTSVVILL